MPRKHDQWIEAYMQLVSNTEPPILFHMWTAIATVAAALRRQVWLPWGFSDLYPNFYILLVGPPGTRKGTAMRIGKSMLQSIKIPLGADCVTRAKLIQDLEATTAEMQLGDVMKHHCSLSLFSEEFVVAIGDRNPEMVSTLTDLFDCPETWNYSTKNKGTNELTNAWLNILGATTPGLLQSKLSGDAIGGGLTSRMILVSEQYKGKNVALPMLDEKQISLHKSLCSDLEQISLLRGPFKVTKEVLEHYREWYERGENQDRIKDDKFAGYNARRSTHLRKLMMVLAASRSDELLLTTYDFIRALSILEATEEKMDTALAGVGRADHAQVLYNLVAFIKEVRIFSWQQVLAKFLSDADGLKLRALITNLLEQGFIEPYSAREGGPWYVHKDSER